MFCFFIFYERLNHNNRVVLLHHISLTAALWILQQETNPTLTSDIHLSVTDEFPCDSAAALRQTSVMP